MMAKLAVGQSSHNAVQEGRFYINADSTQDVSNKEITALLVRYFESNECSQLASVERLVGVLSS